LTSLLFLHSIPPLSTSLSFPSITSQCCSSNPSPLIDVASFFLQSHLSVAPPFPPPHCQRHFSFPSITSQCCFSVPSPSLSTSPLLSLHHISVLLLHSLPPHCQPRPFFPSITPQCCFSISSPLIVNVASPFPPSHLSVAPPFNPPSLSTSLSLYHISVLLRSLHPHCQRRFSSITPQRCFSVPSALIVNVAPFSLHHISVLLLHSLPLIVNVASFFPPSHHSVAPPFPPPHCQYCSFPSLSHLFIFISHFIPEGTWNCGVPQRTKVRFGNNCVVSNHPWQRLGGGDVDMWTILLTSLI